MGKLYPEDLQERFNAERWMDWQQTTFSPAGRDAFWQLIRVPEPEQDKKKIEASVATTDILLDRFEQHLTKQEYVAGSKLTMADIPMACEIHRWYGLPVERKPRKHIEAWYAKINARPASKNVLTYPLS
jgi:glutathione S-transferase